MEITNYLIVIGLLLIGWNYLLKLAGRPGQVVSRGLKKGAWRFCSWLVSRQPDATTTSRSRFLPRHRHRGQ